MAIPISEYKGVLQKLTNGQSAPYFGIRGQDVTSVMMESGIPSGVYITDSIADGPAYNVGIQNGDILAFIFLQQSEKSFFFFRIPGKGFG